MSYGTNNGINVRQLRIYATVACLWLVSFAMPALSGEAKTLRFRAGDDSPYCAFEDVNIYESKERSALARFWTRRQPTAAVDRHSSGTSDAYYLIRLPRLIGLKSRQVPADPTLILKATLRLVRVPSSGYVPEGWSVPKGGILKFTVYRITDPDGLGPWRMPPDSECPPKSRNPFIGVSGAYRDCRSSFHDPLKFVVIPGGRGWSKDGDAGFTQANLVQDATLPYAADSLVYEFDVTKTVQAWAGGEVNDGFAVQVSKDTTLSFRNDLNFFTSLAEDVEKRPLLTVQCLPRPAVARPSLEFTPEEIREIQERVKTEPAGADLTRKLIEGKYDDLPAAWFSKMLRGPHPGVKHPVFKPEGDEAAIAALKEKVEPYLQMSEAELRKKIDERGSLEGDNFKMRETAYDLAMAGALTKEPVYVRRALIVLDRYAEVLPCWPVSGQHGVARQDNLSYFNTNRNWAEGDLWTPKAWYHGNLINAAPLFKAWDLVCDSPELGKLSAETEEDIRTKILDDLLYRTIKVHLQWPFSYGNMYGHRLGGLAQCGLALGDPMIVHAVVRECAKGVQRGFQYDGTISETAPGYGRQLLNRLIWCMGFLKGYSDPEGYVDPIDRTSIKNFDPENGLVGTRLARCKAAVDALALPTGYALAVHDEEYGPEMKGPAPSNAESKIYGPQPTQSVPRLLGATGHAVLGAGADSDQIQAHLHFSGCYGHDHCDHLSLFLFAQGEELYSDTGYRADSGGDRGWKASTAAHNTVMINEKDLPRGPNDPPASIHGNLVFWSATDPEFLAVEADWKNAQAKQYRRLAALVHLEGNRYYVFDLFRVNGGKTHDWMLHGPLHTDYTIESPLELKPRAGKIVEIAELRSAVTGDPISWTIRAGKSSVRALLAAAPDTEAIMGQGPAVRRPGKQIFTAVRRTGGKSLYAAVHEPLYGEPRVKSIEVLGPQDPDASLLVTKVVLEGDRIDFFLSTLDAQPPFVSRGPVAECSLAGSFAHVVEIGGKVSHAELVGSELAFHGVKIQGTAYSGKLLGVDRMETGAKRNAFLTEQELPPGESLKGASLILTYADGRTHGYTVERVEADGDKRAILVREEPGVEITPETARFVYFPGNEFKGPTSFRIVPCTVWTGESVPQGKSRP